MELEALVGVAAQHEQGCLARRQRREDGIAMFEHEPRVRAVRVDRVMVQDDGGPVGGDLSEGVGQRPSVAVNFAGDVGRNAEERPIVESGCRFAEHVGDDRGVVMIARHGYDQRREGDQVLACRHGVGLGSVVADVAGDHDRVERSGRLGRVQDRPKPLRGSRHGMRLASAEVQIAQMQ